MTDSSQLDVVLAEWLQHLDRGFETQVDMIALHQLFKAWQSKTPDQNKIAINYVLKGKTFLSLFSYLINQASNRLDPTTVVRLRHNTHRGAYSRLNQLMGSSDHGTSLHTRLDDSLIPNDLALQTCLRALIEFAFDPPEQQTELLEDESEPHRDDLASLVRSSFALPFRGPAVELLLAHIQAHEREIQRAAEVQRARIQAALTQQMDSRRAVIDQTSHPPLKLTNLATEQAAASREALVANDLYYAKVLPIIQSSGFGKSKLCIHLSAAQPGMLVCLRSEPKVPVSFPPQDASVYDYFEECYTKYFLSTDKLKHSAEDSNMIHTTITSFLAAYCSELHLLLRELMRISGCFPPPLDPDTATADSVSSEADASGHDIQMCWNTVVFSLGVSLHVKVDFLAQLKFEPPHQLCPHSCLGLYGLLGSHAPHSTHVEERSLSPQDRSFVKSLLKQRAREDLLGRICTRAEQQLLAYEPSDHPEGYKTPVARILSPALSLLEGLVPIERVPSAIFFLALDDCSTFSEMLPHLRRVWNAAKPARMWLLLVDTNSRIAPLIGRESRESGRRTMKKPSRLVQPFVDMPLDINFTPEQCLHVHKQILDQTCTLRSLNQLVPRLGRPLWNNAMYSDSNHVIQPEKIFVRLVQPETWKWPHQLSDSDIENWRSVNFHNIMALLSQRVSLGHSHMASQHPWNVFAQGQVRAHLRYLCDYPLDSEDVLNTHVPSEPALSLAVTWSFRHLPDQTATKWSLAVCTMASAQSSIGVDVGLQGEEGVHVLCCMAADLAASARYRAQLTASSPDYASLMGVINLSEWLDSLIGSSDAANDPELQAWCRRQWLNFKHVADFDSQIKRGAGVPIDMLGESWMRHAAIRGVAEQCGWDLLLPIYECDKGPPVGDELFLMHKLSYVALQVKNCAIMPAAPDVIGPSLPDLEVATQSMVSLELFLDLGDAGSTRGWSRRKHQYQSRQTVHRVSVSGHGIETFPLLAELDAKAQDKVPVIFGLPTSREDDFWIDKANYVRTRCQEPLLSYLRQAQTVKDGKMNPTTCIPGTTALTNSMSEGQRRSKRLREDSTSTQNPDDS